MPSGAEEILDIQICQCCGIIIRGKSKFCTGCGTTISKFSPVTLPVISHTAAPLAVTLDPDPLVLERTIVKLRYSNVPAAAPQMVPGGQDGGNGHGNGNGHGSGNGNGHGQMDDAGQQAAASTSKLQNILGNAASRNVQGGTSMSGMMSMFDDEEGGAAAGAAEAAPTESGAMYHNAAAEPEELAAVAQAQSFEPQAPMGGSAGGMQQAVPTGSAQRPNMPGTATVTRIVLAAGAFDALAGSTSTTIPVTVTTALSPGLDAGSVVATNLSAAPNAVPITSAEPPGGLPKAGSYPNATTVVAPQTGSPESIAMPGAEAAPAMEAPVTEQIPQPPATFESPQFSTAGAVSAPDAVPNVVQPPSGVPDFFDGGGQASQAMPDPSAGAIAAPSAEQAAAAEAPQEEIGMPPLTAIEPAKEEPAAQLEPGAGGDTPPPLVIAPPTIPSSPNSDITPAPATTFTASPSTPGSAVSSFSPVAGGNAFDFFAATTSPTPSIPAPSAEAASPSLGSVVTPEPAKESSVLDANKFSNGVPSVVANAIRAAASASQTGLPPVKTADIADDSKTTLVSKEDQESLFPDESSNRGKKKSSDSDDLPSSRRRNRGDDEDEDDKSRSDKEPDKILNIGGMELKMKSALTAGILLVFLGLPLAWFGINIVGGALSKLAGGGGGIVIGGDWEFGYVNSDGTPVKSTVNFKQAGNTFTGMGVDRSGGFQIINGSVQSQQNSQFPKIQFQKVYVDQQGRPTKKPITYVGAVDWVNPDQDTGKIPFKTHMYGVWQYQARVGYGWRGQIVNRTGKWEAGQIRAQQNVSGSIGTGSSGGGWDPLAPMRDFFKADSPAGMATVFARIAGCLLLLGLALVFLSLKMFGPAGMLNIWSKKEYIPSQFKSQHYKMVRELGKPLTKGGMPLGWRADWNLLSAHLPRKLALPPDIRANNPHLLVLGAGSKGKSRLIASMIHHDIESNDRAVVVIDSDGGLIDLVMAKIASSPNGAEIARRLIIIDPTHGGDVMAYNPLEFPDDGDLQNAASAVVFGFKAIYTEPPGSQSQWNQQTANILRNAAILLMANGKTLTDLPVLLSENDFRDVLLEKVERLKAEKAEYVTLLEAWSQYKRLARTDQWINWVEPILNRVQPMLGDPRIRPILTKTKGDLNLKEIISEGKILFVKVPQGQLDQNANLLGSLIVTGVKQAALSLSLKGSTRKHPCSLYLDEFDNFIEKETYDAITSETKKFQIGFVGASKTLQGLPEDYRNQLIINVGTMCCFALAKKDGDILGPQMFRVDGRKIKHQTLQNIFNKVNTAPQFELISDEEKLNIDRVVGQEERHYFCYRVGTVAGVFQMRAPEFNDIPDKDINWTLIDQIYARSVPKD